MEYLFKLNKEESNILTSLQFEPEKFGIKLKEIAIKYNFNFDPTAHAVYCTIENEVYLLTNEEEQKIRNRNNN